MDCKTTSTNGRAGFTLVELLDTLAVSGLLCIAIAMLGPYAGRTFAGLGNYTDLDGR